MTVSRKPILLLLVALALLVGGLAGWNAYSAEAELKGTSLFAFPGDWSRVPVKDLALFYPGQASWEFLTGDEHPGSEFIQDGESCNTCHEGTEGELGEALVEGGPNERDPISGKAPIVNLKAQAAYDDDYAYFRFQWRSDDPGANHTLWQFDGTKWVKAGGPKPDVTKKGEAPSYEDRLSILVTDTTIPAYDGSKATFSSAGCFVTCHDSMRAMPGEPTTAQVQAHPRLGNAGMKKSDIRKYLLITRNPGGGAGSWDNLKDQQELLELQKQGLFLDLWQWRAARSNPVGYASDDWVFEYRNSDKGKAPFTQPAEPTYAFDKSVTGFSAIPREKLSEMGYRGALIVGKNSVPIDKAGGFNNGDVLPQYVLRDPDGSAADVMANSSYKDGVWTIELRRRLNTGNPDDKALAEGNTYDIGIAIHDDHVSNRRHYVTFPMKLGMGVAGDIQAVRVK